jgi:hypothetical protein
MSGSESQQSYRVLWAQVVLQAKADLENEKIGSVLFNQAAAFFVGRGDWAQSRLIVADCLGMHSDDLTRCGERWIAARRERDGLAPEPKREAVPAKRRGPLPRLVAVPAAEQRGKGRSVMAARAAHPFDPFREGARASAV